MNCLFLSVHGWLKHIVSTYYKYVILCKSVAGYVIFNLFRLKTCFIRSNKVNESQGVTLYTPIQGLHIYDLRMVSVVYGNKALK